MNFKNEMCKLQSPFLKPFQNEHLYQLQSTLMSQHHGRRTPSSPGSRQSWRRTSRSGTLHWRHSALPALSALRMITDVETHAVCHSPLCHVHVCVCVTGERNGEKGLEKEGNWEKLRERYSDAKTDIRCSATTITLRRTLPRGSRAN